VSNPRSWFIRTRWSNAFEAAKVDQLTILLRRLKDLSGKL
jgi:hypothetical protein